MTRFFYHILSILLLFALQVFSAVGQTAIIPIETKLNALVLQVAENRDINILYFGKKLAQQTSYKQLSSVYKQGDDYSGIAASVYTPSGSRNLFEPAISITHADGNHSLELRYVSHNVNKVDDNLTIYTVQLKDPVYDLLVELNYKVYYQQDVIEQWSVITNQEKRDVTLHKFASANLYLRSQDFYLTQYHSEWAKEMRPEESRITHGIKTLDSKLGTRANLFQPSVFMISIDKPASEDEGTVLYGAMQWSGNFKIDLELDNRDNLRLIAGINNYASEYSLKSGQRFETPAFLYTMSHNGKGDASRKLHQWARKYRILDGNGERLTLLNNWESTYFDFNEQKLSDILRDTKKLGVDMFLLDDGWFANKYPRNSDNAGLGDWQENKSKLPNGIGHLQQVANENGVKFGIWIEPEMVNPKSELYLNHPEWVVKQPKRDEYYFRNQLALDLSNPKVQNFVFSVIDTLLIKDPDLAYIKWDCNAVIYNAYSSHLKNQSHFYIEYMRGLYAVLERIRTKYPKIPMMLCSGGGGRVDYAALKYFTEFWPSDNTDPLERIFMQWEYSYFYPSIASANHVTDWGKQSIKYRTDVAMMGKLGFDIVASRLGEKDLAFVQNAVKTYNQIKSTVWHGDQFRLSDPKTNSVAAIMYADDSKSRAVMFSYLINSRYGEASKLPIRLKGLDALKRYRVKELDIYPGERTSIDESQIYTGDFLMNIGLNPDINQYRTSVVLQIDEVR